MYCGCYQNYNNMQTNTWGITSPEYFEILNVGQFAGSALDRKKTLIKGSNPVQCNKGANMHSIFNP